MERQGERWKSESRYLVLGRKFITRNSFLNKKDYITSSKDKEQNIFHKILQEIHIESL